MTRLRTTIAWAMLLACAPAAHARDLTDNEKIIITDAMRGQRKAPVWATYKWPAFASDNPLDYCAWVDQGGGYVAFWTHLNWRDGNLALAYITMVGGSEAPPEMVKAICQQVYGLQPLK